jgi:16S rRNA (guanine527-N7)-methyltransferase
VTSREFRERLARRARKVGVIVRPDLLEALEAYFRLLSHWNERINLTSLPLRAPTDATFDRLLIEPMAAARFVPEERIDWFDLGSGGGSPALPLRLVRPRARLTMVEAKARKAAFLREAVRVLAIADAQVQDLRFETLADRPENAGAADIITVRAVKADATLMSTAAKLLRPRGRLLLFADPPATGTRFTTAFSCEQTAKLSGGESSDLSVFVRLTGAAT